MTSRPARLVLAAAVLAWALPGSGCFPEFTDPGAIENLRVLAVQSDPATVVFDTFPLPSVTFTALVVDPADPDLSETEHLWRLELDEDLQAQFAGLLPDPPYGPQVTLDLNALMGAKADSDWQYGLLPIGYVAQNAELTREAVKFLNFYLPVDPSNPEPIEPPAVVNANPLIESVTVGDRTWSRADSTLPAQGTPLYVGPASATEGLRVDITVSDDQGEDGVWAELYWTTGSPGLPDPDGKGGAPGFGGGFGDAARLDEDAELPRAFGWTPPEEAPEHPARLFVVVNEKDGGQSWIELRPDDAP